MTEVAITKRTIKYQDKFIAFVDILGFKEIVEKSAVNDDAGSIARMIERLGSENDITFYREDGAEICPCSERHSADLAMCISQASDCVIVSAEMSPAGAINIVNHCRKVAERLLLREGVLCRGYLTRGKIVHQGMMFFGPGYQSAVEGEKKAAAIEWSDGVLGTPFIEIGPDVLTYLETYGDACTRKMFPRMTISDTAKVLISPYGIFDRLADWACDPSRSPEERQDELASARKIIDHIKRGLAASKPRHPRGKKILRISRGKLSKARDRIAEAEDMVARSMEPFPAR